MSLKKQGKKWRLKEQQKKRNAKKKRKLKRKLKRPNKIHQVGQMLKSKRILETLNTKRRIWTRPSNFTVKRSLYAQVK